MEEKIKKTGTTTVGIVCKNGVVLAADKKMTLGGMIIVDKKTEKVVIINEDIAVTIAGSVSDIQLLIKIIKAQIKLEELRRNKKMRVSEIANLVATLVYSNIRKLSPIMSITGFLLGGRDEEGCYLYDLAIDGSLIKKEDYSADGSGMMFALGVLEANYKQNIGIDEGVNLALKAISAAAQRDTASGEGIDIVTVTKEGVKKVFSKQIDTKLI